MDHSIHTSLVTKSPSIDKYLQVISFQNIIKIQQKYDIIVYKYIDSTKKLIPPQNICLLCSAPMIRHSAQISRNQTISRVTRDKEEPCGEQHQVNGNFYGHLGPEDNQCSGCSGDPIISYDQGLSWRFLLKLSVQDIDDVFKFVAD